MRKLLHILYLLCVFHNFSFGQDIFGGHILGQKWQILSSPSANIIFPKGIEPNANRVANIVNYIDKNNRRSIGNKKGKINIVLQTQTVEPNGYVALAPFRSEFFCTPPATNLLIGSQDWLDALAVHEYRHVLQNLNTRRGITKIGSYLMGQSIWATLTNLAVPNWYLEGDAVIAETAQSLNGRGRSSFFSIENRSLSYADIKYPYQKFRNDSYKDVVPDHYRLGYLMLSTARELKGNDITSKVLADAAKYKGIIYPFSKALKRHVGLTSTQLYNKSWQINEQLWQQKLNNTKLIPTDWVTSKSPQTPTDYRFPFEWQNNCIIARKKSYKQTERFILIKNGKEKLITTIGFNNDEFYNLSNNKLLWTETTKNPRRGYQDFSNIYIYDLITNQKRQLTFKSRYTSPVLAPDGYRIAAIYNSPLLRNEIHIIDGVTGNFVKKYPVPENFNLSRLTWTKDGKSVITVAKQNSRLALYKFDLKQNIQTQLSDWTHHTIDAPHEAGGKIYFNASFTGIDNIFSTDLEGGRKIVKVTSVPVGAFEPSISKDGKSIYFTQYTNRGYAITKQELSTEVQTPISIEEPFELEVFKKDNFLDEGGNIFDKIPVTNTYKVKPYNGLFTGLKLHSWSIIPTMSQSTVSIHLTNLLNDVSAQIGTTINHNEKNKSTFNTNINIARFYPDIKIEANLGQRSADVLENGLIKSQNFDELSFGSNISLPLEWKNGNFTTTLLPSIGVQHRSLSNIVVSETTSKPNYSFLSTKYEVNFKTIRRHAYQNVGPRAGLTFDIQRIQSYNTNNNTKFYTYATAYLPGLGRNHNLKIAAGYQKEPLKNSYQFADNYIYPRAYNVPLNDEFSSLSFTYGLPLLYPDAGFAGITYFKRIRANIFYDLGRAKQLTQNKVSNLRSTGIELLFDNTILNVIPMSFGLRNSILIDTSPLSNNTSRYNLSFFVSTGLN